MKPIVMLLPEIDDLLLEQQRRPLVERDWLTCRRIYDLPLLERWMLPVL